MVSSRSLTPTLVTPIKLKLWWDRQDTVTPLSSQNKKNRHWKLQTSKRFCWVSVTVNLLTIQHQCKTVSVLKLIVVLTWTLKLEMKVTNRSILLHKHLMAGLETNHSLMKLIWKAHWKHQCHKWGLIRSSGRISKVEHKLSHQNYQQGIQTWWQMMDTWTIRHQFQNAVETSLTRFNTSWMSQWLSLYSKESKLKAQ